MGGGGGGDEVKGGGGRVVGSFDYTRVPCLTSVFARDGIIVHGKRHTRSVLSFKRLLVEAALETVPWLVRLDTDRPRPRKMGRRPFPFSHLSVV